MSKKKPLSRRAFLRGAAGITVALPLLSANPFLARGEEMELTGPFPKRFIFMIDPNGVIQDDFWPTAGMNNRDFNLGAVLSPLADFQDRLLVLKGLDFKSPGSGPGEPHQTGMGGVLTGRPLLEGNFRGNDGTLAGWGSGKSLDQEIAETIGNSTPRKSLELGVRADVNIGSDVSSRISYADSAQPLPPQNDPRLVFEDLFTNLGMGGGDEDAQRILRDKRLSVLDSVQEQFKYLQPRISASDRERLDQHFTMVRDIELRLQNEMIGGADCTPPPQPEEREPDSEETMDLIAKVQIDMMVAAMACDLTRVATLQISNSRNHIRYPWVDSLGDGHGLSHAGPSNANARSEWNARDRWHAGLMKYICQRLDAIQEGEGSMLDNSVIVWTSEIAQGNTHSHKDMPFVLAGSAGGFFDTGQFISFNSRSHNDLLTTLGRAYGLDIDSFGTPQFNQGILSPIIKS